MASINRRMERPVLRTHEGAPARRVSAVQELRRSVMSCLLWEREFYEGGVEISKRIADLVRLVPAEEAAAVAIEAREKMYLRHVPLWIVRHMAEAGGSIVGDTLARVIQRADELYEFVALYWMKGKVPLSAQVKKGLASAFQKFDAYNLAKWNRDGGVRLRDVLFLVHPKPKDAEQQETWNQLVNGTLPTPDTWETELSAGKDKKATWIRLIEEKKLGGLALLRNLRNMLEVKVPVETIRRAIRENAFKYVLPFRFIAAARYAPELEPDLEQAMFRALKDAPKLPGKTALLVDHSGSMLHALSEKSDLTRFDAACALAVLLREVCESVDVVAFSAPVEAYHRDGTFYRNGRHEKVHGERPAIALVPPRRGFALRDAIDAATPWWGTNTEDGKKFCDERGYDRLIIITDEQSNQAISNPKGIGYVINVASAQNGIGYGAWTHIDGFSENVVRYIQEVENAQ